MKRYSLKPLSIFFLLIFYCVSCQQSKETEIRNDLDQFEAWLNERSEHIENFSDQEWKEAQDRYNKLQDDVENNFNQLSQNTQDRYNDLKARFQEWQEDNTNKDVTQGDVFSTQEDVFEDHPDAAFSTQLLGDYSNLSTITALNVKNAYMAFITNVRDSHKTWDKPNWDKAQIVYSELNERKDEVSENIPAEDKIKITALQAEFNALRTGDNLSDKIEDL